jgi:hypothetical protein
MSARVSHIVREANNSNTRKASVHLYRHVGTNAGCYQTERPLLLPTHLCHTKDESKRYSQHPVHRYDSCRLAVDGIAMLFLYVCMQGELFCLVAISIKSDSQLYKHIATSLCICGFGLRYRCHSSHSAHSIGMSHDDSHGVHANDYRSSAYGCPRVENLVCCWSLC